MMRKQKTLLSRLLLCSAFSMSVASMNTAQAAVSAAEAARLDKDLTPFGAIREGNAEFQDWQRNPSTPQRIGAIPEWTGGLSKPPAGYGGSGQPHIDPYSADKVLVEIDSKNKAKYDANLTPGLKALLDAYPTTLKLPVYTSRRSHTTPDWVIKNTKKNATSAVLTADGAGIDNAYGGVPFPILSGNSESMAQQAIWNHLVRWRGVFVTRRSGEVAVQQNGAYNLTTSQQEVFFNFFNPEGSEKTLDNKLFYYLSFTTAPPRLAGGAVLVHETLDQVKEPRDAWGYNAGQRRVRRAPNLAYDSPIAAADNLRTADDTDMFNGALDRYNWSYKGVKEIYIPYNSYKVQAKGVKYADLLGMSHINPNYTRWELHRVHVVEANLKSGARHIYKKRVFYLDEDSWGVALMDQYDSRGDLWRLSVAFLKNFYELPGVWTALDVFYDLQARRYHVQGLDSEEPTTRVFENRVPDGRYFQPATLRRRGIR